MRKIVFFLLQVLISTSVFAQNLNRLEDRANKYLALRSAGNRAEAVTYVEISQRNDFINRTPPLLTEPQILALEFTDNPKLVYVAYKANVKVAETPPISATIREPWLWNGKDWFLTFDNIGNAFASNNHSTAAPPKALHFELSTGKIDFGKHIQGDVIKQTINFTSDQDDLLLVELKSDCPGLFVGSPVWTSEEGGSILVSLDSTFLNQDIQYSVELQAIGRESQKTKVTFDVLAEIEQRLRFSQNPEVIDPSREGTVELRVENLSGIPIKVNSMSSTNTEYHIATDLLPSAEPGQTFTVTLTYGAQPAPRGAALYFETARPVAATTHLTVPLHIKLPTEESSSYTKEQLDRFRSRDK
jgi:hypothetical protein